MDAAVAVVSLRIQHIVNHQLLLRILHVSDAVHDVLQSACSRPPADVMMDYEALQCVAGLHLLSYPVPHSLHDFF